MLRKQTSQSDCCANHAKDLQVAGMSIRSLPTLETADANGNWEGWFMGTIKVLHNLKALMQATITVPEVEIPSEGIELL